MHIRHGLQRFAATGQSGSNGAVTGVCPGAWPTRLNTGGVTPPRLRSRVAMACERGVGPSGSRIVTAVWGESARLLAIISLLPRRPTGGSRGSSHPERPRANTSFTRSEPPRDRRAKVARNPPLVHASDTARADVAKTQHHPSPHEGSAKPTGSERSARLASSSGEADS
jgi:hypothetical protein